MSAKVAVIAIPTFNEAKNIGITIDYLCTKTFPDIDKEKWTMKILVFDDNSPDGTGQVVLDKAKVYPNVHLLITGKKKGGIGAGYLKAFSYAIRKLSADFVFEFDSDLQHPPETIPVMLSETEKGYDYVIGSRKIKGGSNPAGWGFKRLFFSEVGGFVARSIMFFPFKYFWIVTDPTTGLKVTRVKGFLDQIDLDPNHLYTKSFGYKLELLYQTLKLKAKFKEIPLQFHIRKAGESKIDPQTAKEIFRTALLLRWHDDFTQKFLKFGLVGGIGFLINFFGFRFFKVAFKTLPLDISLINWIANAIAAEIAIISNFTWNNLWTFAKEKITSVSQLASKFVTFNLSSIVTGILIPSTFIGVCTYLFGDKWSSIYLVIAVFGLTIPLNWFVYNRFIWKKK